MASGIGTDRQSRHEPNPRRSATGIKASRCPGCQGQELEVFWETHGLPIHCHLLCETREAARSAATGDIALAFCRQCGLIHNIRFDPGLMNYAPEYENALDHSPRFQRYMQALAHRLIDHYNLTGKNIIEIACGQGRFLDMICSLGNNRGIGFDPSCPDHGPEGKPNERVTLVRDYYSPEHANAPADLICCRHALEHMPEPLGFLNMIRKNLDDRPETIVFFEVPEVLYTLRQHGIWDVIYEHCLYFTSVSLAQCFRRTGFEVMHLQPEYDGQFLCIETRPGSTGGLDEIDADALAQLTGEVEEYGRVYKQKVEYWRGKIDLMRRMGQKVVLWGSGSKGVTFLNTLRIYDGIGYVVDINPRKEGMHVTGTGQKIVAPEFLKQYRPDTIIIMNPIYQEEITQSAKEMGLSPEVLVA